MTLLTHLTTFIAESLRHSASVAGEVMDSQSKKVFRFRGKATFVRAGENPVTYVSISEVEKAEAPGKKYVLVDVASAEEISTENPAPAKPKLTYHNLWKF